MNTKVGFAASFAAASILSVANAYAGVDVASTAVTASASDLHAIADAQCDWSGYCVDDEHKDKDVILLSTPIDVGTRKKGGTDLLVRADLECGTIFTSERYLNIVSTTYNAGVVKMWPVLVPLDNYGTPVGPEIPIGTFGTKDAYGKVHACKNTAYETDIVEIADVTKDKVFGTHGFQWATSKKVPPGKYKLELRGTLIADSLVGQIIGLDVEAKAKTLVGKRIMTANAIVVGKKLTGWSWKPRRR